MNKFTSALLHAMDKYQDKVAIVDQGGNRQTTYRELYTKALRVASYLQKNEFQKGDCIMIFLPQDMEYIAAVMGCWIRGCIPVPASVTYPQQRIDYILNHSQSRIRIDEEILAEIYSYSPEADIVECGEEDIVMIYYTSGSTGDPKGVMHNYAGFNASRLNALRIWELSDAEIVGNSAPLYFCASSADYDSLTVGATVHLYDEGTRRDVQIMSEYILRWGITRAFMSPTVVAQYKNLSEKLELVITASERLTGVKPEGFRLKNVYGSTEIISLGFCFEVTKAYDNTPIGMPAEGIQVSIQDNDGNILPEGEEGEICLKGSFTPGYYKDPEKTATLWRGGWLHSNDIGKILPDGNMLFVNRKDWMLKISGQRVEPGEVETIMKRCPGVRNAIVKGFQNKKGGNYICGYYILNEGTQTSQTDLVSFMQQFLPDYMIPTCFQQMKSFPLNPNGKIDRKSLKSPFESENTGDEETLSPLEKELQEITTKLLGYEKLSVEANLGYEGLTSIIATKLASRIYRKYRVQTDVRLLVKDATIRSLAMNIESAVVARPDSHADSPTKASLTFPQQGVYADCVMEPESLRYNVPFAVNIPEGITIETLQQALQDFVSAHSYINCHFVTDDEGNVIQQQIPEYKLKIPVLTLSEEEFEAEKKIFPHPFDLANGPLYRFEIVSINNNPSSINLLFDFHHLIVDGMSIDLFFSQLCQLLGGESILPEDYTYYNYAHDEHIDDASEQFFATRLSLVDEASMLIADNYNPDGRHIQKSLYHKVNLTSVKKLSKEMGVSTSSAFLSAVAFTVSRFTAEETVGLCTISNGRSNSLIAENMGMFVNTLPLVCQVSPELSVADYLHECDSVFMSTIRNEHYPFTRIAQQYGYAPNVMFAYQVDVFNNYHISGQILCPKSLEVDTAKFPIAIFIEGNSSNGEVDIHIDYDSDMYTEGMIAQFAESVANVLHELGCRDYISQIECCSENQIALLDSFNHPIPEFEDETILEAFQKAVHQYPDNIAAIFKDKKYTYRDLDELTDKISSLIYCSRPIMEVQGGVPVISILIPRNEYMFILPLAAMKAGCAYQPLDPSYPQERLNFMIKDADAVMLIADPDLRPIINSYEGPVILTNELTKGKLSLESHSLSVGKDLEAEDLFILLYTSGSTGVPKGVMIEHRNLMHFIYWYRHYYDLTPESRVAAYASFGFDACMMDLFPALTTGATVCVVPEEMRMDMTALNDYFEQNGITLSFMTTQVGVQFHETIKNRSLRHLSVGGEKLVSVDPGNGYTLHNCYGPTECTIFSTTSPVLQREANMPIGKPVDTLNCYVMDKHLHRLPYGAAGELVIVGKQVCRGYLNQPDKTAEAFFTYNGMRAYHSGDIVRYRKDGNIEFVGRKDGQVKIRGFRIEIKEVEAVIREMPEVYNVTVQAFDNPVGGKFIAAYVVMKPGCSFSSETIAEFIRLRKPPYMVPASIMQLDNIPLNVNQKVDKRALPSPLLQDEQEFVAPANELETNIAEAFAKVLGLSEKVSVLDNFTELGGDSIKAIRLVTALRQKNISLTVAQILQTGTVRGLAVEVNSSACTGESLTFSQEAFTGVVEDTPLLRYFHDLHLAKPSYFNQAFLFKTGCNIDREALKTAIGAVCAHHDMLRATLQDGHIVIADEVAFDFEELTLSPTEVTAECICIQEGIDLEKGPWLRCALMHIEGADYLFMVAHHLVVDGISWRIITDDLNTAYQQVRDGEELRLHAKTASYDAWAKALARFRSSNIINRQNPYWTDVQKRRDRCELSWSKDRGFCQKRIEISLDSELAGKFLTSSKRAYNTQTDDLFLSALSLAWNRLTGIDNIAIQLEGHGRESFDDTIQIDRTVGWFTSIYPLVLENKGTDIRHTILSTKQILRRLPQKGFVYPQLMGIDTRNVPLFTFNYLGALAEKGGPNDFCICQDYYVGPFMAPENMYGTDITLNGYQSLGGSIDFMLEYNTYRFSEEEMQRFAQLFVEAMNDIIVHTTSITVPVKTVSDLGETEWSEDEFENIYTDYLMMGEEIESIRPLTQKQITEVEKYIMNPDIVSNIVNPLFQFSKVNDRSVYEDIVIQLYRKHESLRRSVAMYGVCIPRVVVTSKKPNVIWYDLTEEKLSEEQQFHRVSKIWDSLYRFPYMPQDESPLRIALVKVAPDRQYLACCFHTILLGMSDIREILADLFGMIGQATKDTEAQSLSSIIQEVLENKTDETNADDDSDDSTEQILKLTKTDDVHIYSEHEGMKKLFFFHTANTGSEAYFNLAKQISNQCSFYAFEQYNINHMDNPIEGGIHEIAATYIDILQQYQPHGPYILGGWCYGGTIAYEVAQQLTKAGEQVEHLIMLDTHLIDNNEIRDFVFDTLRKRNREYLSTADLFAGMRNKGLLEPLIHNSVRTTWNWLYYEPQPYDASPVTYFKAVVKSGEMQPVINMMYDYVMTKRAGGYEKVISDSLLNIYNVQEEHDSMMSQRSLDVIVPEIKKILE